MCGITGVYSVGTLDLSEETFFRQALLCDTVRGWDSTGITRIDRDGSVDTLKAAMNAGEFLEQPEVKALLNRKDPIGYIGHNRWATMGAVNMDNSHPFTHDKITLCHNGTLDTVYDLDTPTGEGDTDSEMICYTMSKRGESQALALIDGAYTLAWMNEGDNSFNLARNGDRPMYFSFDNTGTSLFFASERGMLLWLLEKNKIYHKPIQMLKVDTHYKIKLEVKDDKTYMRITEYPIVKKYIGYTTSRFKGNQYSRQSNASCVKEVEFNFLGTERYHGDSEHGKIYGVHYDEYNNATQVVCSPVKIEETEHLDPWELLKGTVSYSTVYTSHPEFKVYMTNYKTQIVLNDETLILAYSSSGMCHNCYSYQEIAWQDGENQLCLNCIDVGKELIGVKA